MSDGFVPRPDGTIWFGFGGEEWVLRIPLISEYEKLRTSFYELGERDIAALRSYQRSAVEMATKNLADEKARLEAIEKGEKPKRGAKAEVAPDAQSDGSAAIAVVLQGETSVIGWWQDVFGMLADHAAPARGDFPVWMTADQLPNKCIRHWRSEPAGPFDPSAPTTP